MRRIQVKIGAVVDIKENAVKPAARHRRVEARVAAGQVEEITLDKPAARIVASPVPSGSKPASCHSMIGDRYSTTVREATDWKPRTASAVYPSPSPPTSTSTCSCATGLEKAHRNRGKRGFRRGEHVRHQMLVIQDDFDDIAVELQDPASAQDKLAKRRLPVVQFFKQPRHTSDAKLCRQPAIDLQVRARDEGCRVRAQKGDHRACLGGRPDAADRVRFTELCDHVVDRLSTGGELAC